MPLLGQMNGTLDMLMIGIFHMIAILSIFSTRPITMNTCVPDNTITLETIIILNTTLIAMIVALKAQHG